MKYLFVGKIRKGRLKLILISSVWDEFNIIPEIKVFEKPINPTIKRMK